MLRQQILPTTILILLLIILPIISFGQATADGIHSLQSVLDNIYKEMIPLCGKLTGVGRVIAGFAALSYISVRVWRHIARAEPVDFFPLFRPFCLGMVIVLFPYVISLIDGIMSPTVTGTASLVEDSNKTIQVLLAEKEKAINGSESWKAMVGETGEGNYDLWLKYAHQDVAKEGSAWYEKILYSMQFELSKGFYAFKNSVKQVVAEILQIIYEAAALCINTIRTFNLVVLAIIGPIVCGIAVFDGFQHTLVVWLARYLNVYLWLPVCNIFSAITGKIMENMLQIDIQQVHQTGDTFFSGTDIGYIIFMLIAIIGYTTVPSVAGHIINAGDRGAITDKVTRISGRMAGGGISAGGAMIGGAAGMAADALVDARANTSSDYAGAATAGGYFSNSNDFQRNKIGG